MSKVSLQGVGLDKIIGRRNLDDPKDPHRYVEKRDIGRKKILKLTREGHFNAKTGYERTFSQKNRELVGENESGRQFQVVFKKRKCVSEGFIHQTGVVTL